MKLDLRDIDLALVSGSTDVAGRVSLRAEASGPLATLVAARRRSPTPRRSPCWATRTCSDRSEIDCSAEPRQTLVVKTLHLKRKAGGALDIRGKVGVENQDLDLDVVLDKLPLAGLPGVVDAGVPVSGSVSAKLHVGGRPDRPELGGQINLADVSVRGVRLGAGQLTLSPTPVGPNRVPGVAIHGRLFDRFDIDAQAALGPKGPHIHGELDFRRVEIEALAPELVAFGDARGIDQRPRHRRHGSGAAAGAGRAPARAMAVGGARR